MKAVATELELAFSFAEGAAPDEEVVPSQEGPVTGQSDAPDTVHTESHGGFSDEVAGFATAVRAVAAELEAVASTSKVSVDGSVHTDSQGGFSEEVALAAQL